MGLEFLKPLVDALWAYVLPPLPAPDDKDTHISDSDWLSAGFWGGAVGGLLLAILVVILKSLAGFNGTPIGLFRRLWPLMVFLGTASGCMAGWLCSRNALSIRTERGRSGSRHRLLQAVVLFVCGFFILIAVHQLPSRDALVICGQAKNYLRDPLTDEPLRLLDPMTHQPIVDPSTGQFEQDFRLGGGPLGEPDFETLASGVMGGACFLFLARALARFKRRAPTRLEAIGAAIRVALVGAFSWGAMYALFLALDISIFQSKSQEIRRGIFLKPYIVDRCVFVADFPHPERVFVYVLFALCFVMAILLAIKFRAEKGSIIRP